MSNTVPTCIQRKVATTYFIQHHFCSFMSMFLRRSFKADRVLTQRLRGKCSLVRSINIRSQALKHSTCRPRDKTLFSASAVLFSSAAFALSSYTFAENNDDDSAIIHAGNQSNCSPTEEIVEPSKTCNTILADRHRVSLCGRPVRAAADSTVRTRAPWS